MGRIGVIVNPYAKGNAKTPGRRRRLQDILGGEGIVYQSDRLELLPQVCADIARQPIDLVAVCGGDGSLHIVTSHLINAFARAEKPLPTLAFLRGGSMNTIAWNIGQRGTAEKTLHRLVARHAAGGEMPGVALGTVRVNDFYGYFFGAGYVVNFLDEYYAQTLESGPARAVQITLKAMASVFSGHGGLFDRLRRRLEATVIADGETIAVADLGIIMASRIESIGIGFRPMYRARERADRFHALISGLTTTQILAQINRFRSGAPLKGDHHVDCLAARLELRAPQPIGYTLDGELYRENEIVITCGPELRIAVV